MNKKEFLEMQEELARYIMVVNQKHKLAFQTRVRYFAAFNDIIKVNRELEVETGMLQASIKMKIEGKSMEDIHKFQDEVRAEYIKNEEKLEAQTAKFKTIVERMDSMSQKDRQKLDEAYLDFLLNYYPPVKVNTPDKYKHAALALDNFYFEDDAEHFLELFELNKENFASVGDIKEEEYNSVSMYYYDLRKNLNAGLPKDDEFPLNKAAIFVDEKLMLAERQSAYDARQYILGLCEAVHKDYVDTMDEDVSLVIPQ